MSADHSKPVIFITGAASGIGRETARLFAAKGWFVGACDMAEPGLRELEAELGAASGSYLVCDVANREAYARTLNGFTTTTGGRLDILMNNAGILSAGPFESLEWSLVERTIRINLLGVLAGIQLALPHLKATPNALCFTTCSASAIFGSPGLAVYSATKYAVRGLTEALSVELRPHGVRVADVLPGLIDTGMMPAERRDTLPKDGPWRLVHPREVAEAAWTAYTSDVLHGYVPAELKDLDVQATADPEAARDRLLATIEAQPVAAEDRHS